MSTSLQTIEIIITLAGEATVQTKGFAGPGCRDASRFIEQALGEKTAEQLTPEFHQGQGVQQQAHQRG
jgi:hypothetical protein